MRNFSKVLGCAAIPIFAVLASSVCPQTNSKDEKLHWAADHAMDGRAGAIVAAAVGSNEILAARRLESPGSALKLFVLMELLETGKLNGGATALPQTIVDWRGEDGLFASGFGGGFECGGSDCVLA